MYKCYSDLMKLETFKERYDYLKLLGSVGKATFGAERYLNQVFYASRKWKDAKSEVLIRDNGCDLAMSDRPIGGRIFVHHINPITIENIQNDDKILYDPENLISVSFETHNAIHYGDESQLLSLPVERGPNDMCPWK